MDQPDAPDTLTQDLPGDARWDAFIEWARLFYQWDRFNEHERDYKLEIAQTMAVVRDILLDGFPNWDDGLKGPRAPSYNLINWRVYSGFRNLLEKDKPLVEGVLHEFWRTAGVASLEDRIRQFEERIAVGPRGQMVAAFLMADDPTGNPPYRTEYLDKAYQIVGYPREERDFNGGRRYRHMLDFLDEFMGRAEARGLHIRDRLDAQSLVWCVVQYGAGQPPASDWPEEFRFQYAAFLQGEAVLPAPAPSPEPEPEPDAPPPPDPWSPENLAALTEELLWGEGELGEIIADLREKGQVIFYGPPGTGKTYVARRIAQQCRMDGGDFAIVQFHPSYSYEDFVEGFRPRLQRTPPTAPSR